MLDNASGGTFASMIIRSTVGGTTKDGGLSRFTASTQLSTVNFSNSATYLPSTSVETSAPAPPTLLSGYIRRTGGSPSPGGIVVFTMWTKRDNCSSFIRT